jgi:DUF1680 family protein
VATVTETLTQCGFQILLNGETAEHEVVDGYASLPARVYTPSDTINFTADMTAEYLVPHPLVHQNTGCLAIRRGPIIYALESVGQDTSIPDLRLVRVDGDAALELVETSILHKPVVCIRTRGTVVDLLPGEKSSFGQKDKVARPHPERPVDLTFVPYFAWGNRGPSDMRVWIQETLNRG